MKLVFFILLFAAPAALAQNPADAMFMPPKKEAGFDDGMLGKPKPLVLDAEPGDGVPPPPKIWSGGFELGMNGSQGNSPLFNFRLGNDFERKTDSNLFTTNVNYSYSNQNSIVSQNRALWNMRDEILFGKSPWTLFASSQLEYDQFRDVEFRLGIYGGVGYTIFNDDVTTMKARVGAGAARQIGGPQDRWVPEGLLGWECTHKFTDRQRFIAAVDVYPSLAYFGQYRVRARAAYEIIVAPEWGLTLRIGIQDRYDTNPGDSKRNDFDYFTTIMLRF